MFKIQTFNNIAAAGLEQFPRDRYEISSEIDQPDAIILRSFNLHNIDLPASLKAVARAGVGVNNVPVEMLTNKGVPVFNAAGANANAVCELVITSMLLACRNIPEAIHFANQLKGNDKTLNELVESQKKKFVGSELAGKTLGIIGLGAIGVKTANAALALDMQAIGFDPAITVQRAWELSSGVKQASSMDEVLSQADFITMHVPLMDKTHHLINESRLQVIRPQAVLLNFSRHEIVDEKPLLNVLNNKKLARYVCDFPCEALLHHPKVIVLPHLGASTREAETNCAVAAAKSLHTYLETGNIRSSINFPAVNMPKNGGVRICIANANVPNMVGQISTVLAKANLNIIDMLNKSKNEIAYTLIDADAAAIDKATLQLIKNIEGILMIRVIES